MNTHLKINKIKGYFSLILIMLLATNCEKQTRVIPNETSISELTLIHDEEEFIIPMEKGVYEYTINLPAGSLIRENVLIRKLTLSGGGTTSVKELETVEIVNNKLSILVTSLDESTTFQYYFEFIVNQYSDAELYSLTLNVNGVDVSTSFQNGQGDFFIINENSLPTVVVVSNFQVSTKAKCSIKIGDNITLVNNQFTITVDSEDGNNKKTFTATLKLSTKELQILKVLNNLYEATNGDNWSNKTNWKSTRPYGDWYGITVDENKDIIEINLSYNKLNGYISSELGNLKKLKKIILTQNELKGTVPSNLNLKELTTLDLSFNQFEGSLLVDFNNLPNLVKLDLSDNKLSDSIPLSLYSASKLEYLDLSSNFFDSKISDDIGNLNKLVFLSLANNDFNGELPESLFNITSLTQLILEFNKFSGELPEFIPKLNNLNVLRLNNNMFTGPILANINELQALKELYLGNNQLTGEVPNAITKLFNLEIIDLKYNNITGQLPADFKNLKKLKIISLLSNQIEGTLDLFTTNFPALEILYLSNNLFTGNIPQNINNLTLLKNLYVGENKLEGSIPASIGDLSQLTILYLENNTLTGSIPVELKNLTFLVELSLFGNNLTGTIPADLSAIGNLKLLYLNNNLELSGSLPGNWCSVSKLNIYNTKLTCN